MKQLLFILIFIFCTNFLWAQDSIAVQVIARPLPNKIMLRWAVNEPMAWKQANEYGFLVERATISRNDIAVVPIERQMLVSTPLKPQPLEAWATLANEDQNVAVMAQALFGDSFEVTTPGSEIGQLYAISEELEQRFTIALLAAEQNYQAAKMAGWGFEDTSTRPNEEYVYTIKVAIPETSTVQIKEGTIFASSDLYEKLPLPIGLAGSFGDGFAQLSWNFSLLQNIYTNYVVERSEDNTNFSQLNGLPIFNAEQNDGTELLSLYYTDSIPNGKQYYYRIKGKTAFDETSEASESVTGIPKKKLEFVPRIYRKEIPTDTEAVLYWQFDKKGNERISGFELQRGNTDKGPFEIVKEGIPPEKRSIRVKDLKRVNYFKIVAKGINGLDSESFTALVQPVDSIPPAPPVELEGVMDTTGVVKLTWTKNLEDDLGGYRIFKSNNPNIEFSELTTQTHEGEMYTDTVVAANLNKKIYYKLQAEDLRYNRSEFSKMLVVDKPDVIAPSPPVISDYEITSDGIQIKWIPSNSNDVVNHLVYRRSDNTTEQAWEEVFVSKSDSTFTDSNEIERNSYSYTIIAKDSVGLESQPATPITVNWLGKPLEEKDIKFSGTVNRELRFINLSWRIKNEAIIEFQLYRGKSTDDLKLYKTLDGSRKSFNDTDLEINSNYTYGLQLVLSGGRTSMIKKIDLKY